MQNEHRFLLAIGRSAHNALSHSTTVLKRSSRLCVFVCKCPGGSSSGNNPSGSDSDVSLCTATKLSSRCAFLLIKNASIQKKLCFTWYLFWHFSSCFFKYLTWEINRIEAPRSGLPRSYRSTLFRPVTVQIVLSITSSVHRHPSSFLCMLCSLLHSLFLLNFLKESREFVVKVWWWENGVCRDFYSVWLLLIFEMLWMEMRTGGEMMLTVYGSLISCHLNNMERMFCKRKSVYFYKWCNIENVLYTVVLKMTHYCCQLI